MLQNRFQWWKLAVPSLVLSSVLVTLWANQGNSEQQPGQDPGGIPTLPLPNQPPAQSVNQSLDQSLSSFSNQRVDGSSTNLSSSTLGEMPVKSASEPLSQNPETTSPSTPVQFGVDSHVSETSDWEQTPTIPAFNAEEPQDSSPILPTSASRNQQELQNKKSVVYKRGGGSRTSLEPAGNQKPSDIIRVLVRLQEETPSLPGKQISFSVLEAVAVKDTTFPIGSKIIGVVGANRNGQTQILLVSLSTVLGSLPISGEILDVATNLPGLAAELPATGRNWKRAVQTIGRTAVPVLTGQPFPMVDQSQPEAQPTPIIRVQNGVAQFRL